jgi:PA14 domain/Binding-protein-dependent transport system inner membrane component
VVRAQLQSGANLSQLFTYDNSIYLRWLGNTLLYAGVGALVGTFLSSMAGFALAKYQFRGRNLVFSAVLGAILVPGTALALPLYLLMSGVNLTNTYWAVLLPSIVSPFGVYLSRIYAASSVPDELLEAARIDGASEFRAFTIALYLMRPALVPSSILTPAGSSSQVHGLHAQYWTNVHFEGEPHLVRIDRQGALNLGFFHYTLFNASQVTTPEALNNAISVRWTGSLKVPVTGEYVLSLTHLGTALLYLDDQLLLE